MLCVCVFNIQPRVFIMLKYLRYGEGAKCVLLPEKLSCRRELCIYEEGMCLWRKLSKAHVAPICPSVDQIGSFRTYMRWAFSFSAAPSCSWFATHLAGFWHYSFDCATFHKRVNVVIVTAAAPTRRLKVIHKTIYVQRTGGKSSCMMLLLLRGSHTHLCYIYNI